MPILKRETDAARGAKGKDMSDSEKTDELDKYGVWIKKDADSADATPADFSLDAELPDLSSLDALGPASAETDATEEDISLDEFIAGGEFEGVAEGNRGYGQEQAPAQPDTTADFGMNTLSDTGVTTPTGDVPLDIDLSFDDGAGIFATESAATDTAEEPTADAASNDLDAGTETIDLSAFGFDDSTADEQPAPAAETETAPEANADSFDDMFNALGDGGTMDASAFFDDDSAEQPAENAPAPAAQPASPDEESVDLSDFGFDDASTEGQGEVKDGTKQAAAQEDYEMTVTADDDEPAPPLFAPQESVSAPAESETHDVSAEPPVPQAVPDAATDSLLSKIMGELDALRGEIAQLKNDFAVMQTKGISEPATKEAETPVEATDDVPDIPAPAQTEPTTGGFFDDNGEDETIALSTDEMTNIMNNADFQSETVETGDEPAAAQVEEAGEQPEESAIADVPEPAQTEPATGGFFDDNGEDETIALSTDEMTNIMNNADFQSETVEAESVSAAEPPVETDDGDANFDATTQVQTPDLPDEIFLPKTDEATEESGTTDTIDSEESAPPLSESEPIAEADEPSSETAVAEEPPAIDAATVPQESSAAETVGVDGGISGDLKQEIKSVLSYMDQLLENLPEDKITEFAHSEQFEAYKKLFKELGLA